MSLKKTPLEKTLAQGMDPGVDLKELLQDLDETPVTTRGEARLICKILGTLRWSDDYREVESRLYPLVALFQDAETEAAIETLGREGIPLLCNVYDELESVDDDEVVDELLFLLKILAMYRTEEGADRVICAAKKPLQPEAYMWSMILGQFDEDHPYSEKVWNSLSDPLPDAFLAVGLLDSANRAAIAGAEFHHPFDSEEGTRRLHDWLTSKKEEEYSYAHSATAALPFISKPARDQLLPLAMDHPEVEIQMEAAWASAKLGSNSGVKMLARFCEDVKYSQRACRYLDELELEEAIPESARDEDFQAMATFSQWLAYPTELGRPPDELEIVDRRDLFWPPTQDRRRLWVIRYRARDPEGDEPDDENYGLVGSVTFCLFSSSGVNRSPEDVYAEHCYWEANCNDMIDEIEVEPDDRRFDSVLAQWQGEPLEQVKVTQIAEFSDGLSYPQERVAVAEAVHKNEPGWAVLDGDQSAWYAKSRLSDRSHRFLRAPSTYWATVVGVCVSLYHRNVKPACGP